MACCQSVIPVASLVGAILQCLGVALFCSSAILGVNESLQLFNGDSTLQSDMDDNIVYYMEIGIYSWTALTMVWAIGFLFIAFMVTAQANRPPYEDGGICCSSPCCIGVSLFLNCFFLFDWVTITASTTMPFTFSLMLSGYYNATQTDPTTVDLRYYGLKEVIEVTGLEEISGQMILYFSLTLGGAALVTFGLVNTIACMASNWVHRRVGDKWKDYAQKRKQEERELHEMTSYKSSERLAQSLYY